MLVVGYGEENGTKYWLIKVRAHAAQQRVWRMHEAPVRGHAPAHCVCVFARTEPNGWLRGAAPFGLAMREELPSAPRRPPPAVGEADGVRCECVAEFMGRIVGREWLHPASAWHQRMRHHGAACNFRFHAKCCAALTCV